MKFKLVTILFVLFSLQLYSQSKTATINGIVDNKLFTYAYLYDAGILLGKSFYVNNW